MTCELITGHAGSAHISAADAGWFNVGVVGEGKYVLDTGTQFACNVQSANLVTIGVGDALFEGRHVRVSATENVALDNGAQGVNRNDLICIKYEYNSSTSVESASLAVIKGSAVSGTPTDPTIPSGSILEGAATAYMPLWRIPIEGITVGTPESMYGDVVVTLQGMLSKTWTASQIPNLSAGKITSGAFGAARIPNLDASKVTSGTFAEARIPTLAASKITSGTFDVGRIPTLTAAKIPNISASKITSDTLAVARGGTGKSYGYTWQQLGTSTGTTAISYSLSGYSEVMFVGRYSTSYLGSVVLPVAQLSSTAREVYLGGGYAGAGYDGRYAALTATSTKATPKILSINEDDRLASASWWVYAR